MKTRTLSELFKVVKQFHPCFSKTTRNRLYMCWAVSEAVSLKLITLEEGLKLEEHIRKLLRRKFGPNVSLSVATEYAKAYYGKPWSSLTDEKQRTHVKKLVKKFWLQHFKEVSRKR